MTFIKRPSDNLPYTFDFTEWNELLDGTTYIVSATVPSVSGLTIGTPVVSANGKQVQVQISGGTDGTTYDIECRATTNHATTTVLVGCGHLRVTAC